jgi:hypothetical protein
VCGGQIRTYCQRLFGFGACALMIAARIEREGKA